MKTATSKGAWDMEETHRIFELRDQLTYKEIAVLLNRTPEAIKKRAQKYQQALRKQNMKNAIPKLNF